MALFCVCGQLITDPRTNMTIPYPAVKGSMDPPTPPLSGNALIRIATNGSPTAMLICIGMQKRINTCNRSYTCKSCGLGFYHFAAQIPMHRALCYIHGAPPALSVTLKKDHIMLTFPLIKSATSTCLWLSEACMKSRGSRVMLTWHVSCRPEFGSRFANRSPTMPPTRFPRAVPPQNRAVRVAAGTSEKPRVCSHIVKYPTAFHGIPPTIPCSTEPDQCSFISTSNDPLRTALLADVAGMV